jgi:type IV secretory pathway TrbD component
MGYRKRRRQSQPIGLRLTVVGLTGFSTLAQGLVGMTSRRWQMFWLVAAVVAMMLLSWLATSDPGVLSKKFW